MAPKKSKLKTIKLFLKLGFLLGILGVVGFGGIFAYYAKDLPSASSISEIKIPESTKIYDRTGTVLLYDIHGEYKRTIIPPDDIPNYAKIATIVAEDDNFYNHFGLDFSGVARAVFTNLKGKKVKQGGSTITQQLIKNIYLSPERTLSRKIKELILAVEMEIKYSKDEILNFYLNAVPYGSNAYGIEAASQTFFNKNAKDLTLSESATLASLPKAPTYYSPFGNNPLELKNRQEYILDRMRALRYIKEAEVEEAKNEEIIYSKDLTGIKAPHFVMYIIEQLEGAYGEDQLKSSGFTVATSLDWDLQQEAEKIVKEWAKKNENRFGAKNAALVALDPSSGEILAMVGSRDYFDLENDGNVNVTTRLRQPGSSFKPFAYARAFEKGYTPDTIVFDVETNFGVQGAKEYIPRNYDGKFRGPITFKSALAQSINIPAIKVLYLAGLADTIKLARDLGIASLNNDPSHYGLSLVLGGGDVTLLEETAAYGVFSQDGIYNKPNALLKVISKDGETLTEPKTTSKGVLDPEIARLINSILSDNDLRSPVFGPNSYLNLPNIPAAVKTGTTQESRDAWTIGYTRDIVVGVWVGNNLPSRMPNASGAAAAAPIWHHFMKRAYEIRGWDLRTFTPPKPINTEKPVLNGLPGDPLVFSINVLSGKIATEQTPKELVEERVFYEPHSLLYFVQKDNPQGPPPNDPSLDPQFELWESAVQQWATSTTTFMFAPTEYDN
ncbi:MAG: PBP1A family penicillin-binding protein [Candidatus Spechtbacterales bacterium]